MALAARPIPGKRWGLWRLRHHTGGLTAQPHQLRRSCVAACVSPVVRRCPVRSLPPLDCGWLGWAGILDRIVWSRIHPTRLSHIPADLVVTPRRLPHPLAIRPWFSAETQGDLSWRRVPDPPLA